MIVLGEVALRKQDFTGAVALFAQAISVTPSARAYGLSAIAKTFLADPTADADWATYLKTQTSPMRFRDVVADTEPATNALFIEFRDALPAIALRHGTTDPTATALKISSISTHLATLLKAIACEEVDHDSKERRVLALTLLSQSASEAVEYLGGQGEDFLTNSRIDLGEAMRQHDAANALMKTP